MKIVITGATGLIGRSVMLNLIEQGHEVIALSRSPKNLPELDSRNITSWTSEQIPPSEVFKNVDALIHLAGEGIADKLWTAERKAKLRSSRINGTNNLVQSLSALPPSERPKVVIAGSAIGYYGNSFEAQNESSGPGSGFLAELCKDWEAASGGFEKLGIRTILMRTGLVLSNQGGLLAKSAPVVLGSGNQWMSWIHIDDVAQFILFALTNERAMGPFNLTAPNPVTNKDFTKQYASCKGIPFTVPAPEFLLKLAMGDLSQAVLANQRVLPSKALALGFQFKYEKLENAFLDLLGN